MLFLRFVTEFSSYLSKKKQRRTQKARGRVVEGEEKWGDNWTEILLSTWSIIRIRKGGELASRGGGSGVEIGQT